MATAYICPLCVFNCDNLPDLEQHLEVHQKNTGQSPIKQQKQLATKSARNSPLYSKPQPPLNIQAQNKSPTDGNPPSKMNLSPVRSSPNKSYDRRYSCKACPFSTHSVKTYFNHRQMAHGEQILVTECPFCDYASQYPGKVKKHLTDEHPSQQMSNGDANKSKNENSLKNELKEKNLGIESIKLSAARFTDCPFCSFTSMDSEEFRQHVLVNHLSDKNFRCLVCNRLYRYRGDCSFHIRKKHSDRMVGDNVESLREYVGEFHPNSMTANELKELLSGPSTPSLASAPSNLNNSSTNSRSPPTQSLSNQQQNPPHSFRCGYCKFSSVNSGDVKKHQTWKHANLPSNILPIEPVDPSQQSTFGYKRKRVHSTKSSLQDEEGPMARKLRLSVPTQLSNMFDSSVSTMVHTNNEDQPEIIAKDLLLSNESGSASDQESSKLKNHSSHTAKTSLSNISSLSSRVYKCIRCDCLAPHQWIIERHIRAKHPSESDDISNLIIKIDKPSTATNNCEPMTATKSSSSSSSQLPTAIKCSASSNQESKASDAVKAFSCSICKLDSYHMWVILRHIRNVHDNDGSNAKIIDNINNQTIDPSEAQPASDTISKVSTIESRANNTVDDDSQDTSEVSEHDENENQPTHMNNEEMIKHLINSALATRKNNANNNFLENLPATLMNNNVAASLATLLGQLTNKQILQQQQQLQQQQLQLQTEKSQTVKRYKCSLCPHLSAWGGNVKKHLKRMHPGEHSGHVIDLSLESAMINGQSIDDAPLLSVKNEVDEDLDQQKLGANMNRTPTTNENKYQQVFY